MRLFDWGFLQQPAGFDIGETGPLLFDAMQPLWWAFVVGLGNTLRVALPSLVIATLLGALLALLRTSGLPGWSQVAQGLIGLIRNVPLLLQLLVWYVLLIEWLPDSTQALSLSDVIWLSKGGLAFPWPEAVDGVWRWSWPTQEMFNVSGGASVTPEYLAVALALSTYTAAFLAEVFRAGIEAVPRPLLEAADTLGATRWQRIRLVLIPQALRTVVPPATNQYLNLTKNSSLAVAVGYPDLVSVSTTALNQSGRVLECVAVMMGVYLLLSLGTALAMNAFNRRQALQGGA
jgi:general L-amino acid transport system permease protein